MTRRPLSLRSLIVLACALALVVPMTATSLFAQSTPTVPGDNQVKATPKATLATPAVVASPAASPVAKAQADGRTYSAYLVEGTCSSMSKLPEPVESLSDATIKSGEQVGAKDGVTAASSTTLLENWTVGDLIEKDNLAVVVTETGDNPAILGCAPVGGVLDEDDALSIAMTAMPGHKSNGMVYISDKEDGMRITIFVHADK